MLLILYVKFFICYYYICATLLVFAVLLAFTDPEPFFTALKKFAFGACGVGCFLALASIARASILKHCNERLTAVGVKRIDREVGIDDGRLTQWVLPILLAVIAVPKLKCLSECRYDLVKIAFFVFRLIRYVFILKKRCKHCASFRIFSKKKNLPYLMITV